MSLCLPVGRVLSATGASASSGSGASGRASGRSSSVVPVVPVPVVVVPVVVPVVDLRSHASSRACSSLSGSGRSRQLCQLYPCPHQHIPSGM
jgi:hypothetical protein